MTKVTTRLAEIGEFGLIQTLARGLSQPGKEVVLGIGDDAAAVDIGEGRYLLATCDIQIENIHFTRHWFTPEQIGWKAAAVNLSDIAAMGGTPRYALVSLAATPDFESDFLVQVYEGLDACLSRFGACIIGGNTSRTDAGLILDVTLLGEVVCNRMLTRNGAAPGEVLLVTGSLGGSRAGLMLLSGQVHVSDESIREEALIRHRRPFPRIEEARIIAARGGTACMDISDGLLGDVRHLAKSSGIRVVINRDQLPISSAAAGVATALGTDPSELALQGGEDFELLFSLPRARVDALQMELLEKTGTQTTEIGWIEAGEGVFVTQKNSEMKSTNGGFDHFS